MATCHWQVIGANLYKLSYTHIPHQESEKNDATKDSSSSSLFRDLKRSARQAISGDKHAENATAESVADSPRINGAAEEKGNGSQPMSLVAPPVDDENDMLHLVPGILCRGRDAFGGGGERVVQVACGNQG